MGLHVEKHGTTGQMGYARIIRFPTGNTRTGHNPAAVEHKAMDETRLTTDISYVNSLRSVFKIHVEQDGGLILHHRECPDSDLQTVRMSRPDAQMLIALLEHGLSVNTLQQQLEERGSNS